MSLFYFDVLDRTRVYIDDHGDDFVDAEDAAAQAVDLLSDLARDMMPGDGRRDFGVVLRDDVNRDVYRAALIFRDCYLDPSLPGAAQAVPATLSVPDPADVIGRSRLLREQAKASFQRLHEAALQLKQATTQAREAQQRRIRDREVEGAAGRRAA